PLPPAATSGPAPPIGEGEAPPFDAGAVTSGTGFTGGSGSGVGVTVGGSGGGVSGTGITTGGIEAFGPAVTPAGVDPGGGSSSDGAVSGAPDVPPAPAGVSEVGAVSFGTTDI